MNDCRKLCSIISIVEFCLNIEWLITFYKNSANKKKLHDIDVS